MVHVQYFFLTQNMSSNRFSLAAPDQRSYIQRNRPNFWLDRDWMDFFHHAPGNDDSDHDSYARLLSFPTKRSDMFGILLARLPSQCAAMHWLSPIQPMDHTIRLPLLNLLVLRRWIFNIKTEKWIFNIKKVRKMKKKTWIFPNITIFHCDITTSYIEMCTTVYHPATHQQQRIQKAHKIFMVVRTCNNDTIIFIWKIFPNRENWVKSGEDE